MPKFIAIIPARYASTRFPGKPLVDIDGKSMIQRVYEQAKQSAAHKVIIATDSELILNHAATFGGYAVMTSEHHQSGTERCGEVVATLLKQKQIEEDDVVINVQGDEPFLKPEQINTLISSFKNRKVKIVTLIKSVKYDDVAGNPNIVKVVVDQKLRALYFSRAPIPFYRNAGESESTLCWKHIGIYAYRVKTLLKLVQLEPTLLEKAEMLEQLRWIEHGYKIRTCTTEVENISIDTPEDLKKITNIFN
ncbi:MAG: 3-deoxy-manno-octulosonate cytidylyltransferase [Bacteroidales bacterium]|jgi:3-deoxy-manno-octulosonate cytidylyltransferase (CMP-KDO synthetase)|nr:3-deoxy-manno-octulosonate cytidylyltransferase [Bacteroidales bacterium]